MKRINFNTSSDVVRHDNLGTGNICIHLYCHLSLYPNSLISKPYNDDVST
jgi:hypothetical protein